MNTNRNLHSGLILKTICLAAVAFSCAVSSVQALEFGFKPIFNGKTLDGWKAVGKQGEGYVVENGIIVCPATGGGNLFTEKDYENFVLRFEFKLTTNANNGIGIRAPFEGDAAYMGMEIQVLDDNGPEYTKLRPEQYHGSIYDTVAANRGSLKPVGEWNKEEIYADWRHIRVTVNGKVIVDANLNDVNSAKTLLKHPGLLRERGHIGFLGHGTRVEFRNLRVKELATRVKDNKPQPGFTALFNGKNIEGWKGLVENPVKRAKMTPEELAAAQAKADEKMKLHWAAKDGVIVFDGKGENLCTKKDYGDFELFVDWKIPAKGDSGIYLRGSPQVQIWEPTSPGQKNPPVGSGGLYNNQKNPADPLKFADNPINEWNHFRIVMIGDKVTVFLNDQMVVNSTTLENYWDRKQPMFPTGQIELQNHGNQLFFKNVYVREIAAH